MLLIWNCLSDQVRFRPIYYYSNIQNNAAAKASNCKFKKLIKRFVFMNNVDLYRFASDSDRFDNFESLYLGTISHRTYLHTNHLIDMIYNLLI